MRRQLLLAVTVLVCLVRFSTSSQCTAQTYISAVGNPSFGVNIPLPNGYINVTNGDLHMEIPLATLKQRGALQLNERLVYDSRIWEIVHYSGYYWWPINVPNSSAGWRFVKGNETGSLGTAASSIQNSSCWNGTYNQPFQITTTYYSWTDPNGTVHPFEAGSTTETVPSNCTGVQTGPEATVWNGYATDASGYYATVTADSSANVSVTIKDAVGNQVYPQVIDRFGNFWTNDSNGNLIDDLGRTPVIATAANLYTTYYDVLAPNGPISNNGTRVRYTVTTEQVTITTAFNQSGVTEYQNNGSHSATITAIQSIGLPDGSSYHFYYDSYGEITSVTLPTGGTVTYGWTNYTDSYQNVNRWLSQSTIAGSMTTYTPSVITQCSANGTGCQESVNVHRPSGDETVYTMTLDNGAWDTNTTVYSGAASANQAKLKTVNTFNFSQACTTPGCNGAQNVTKTLETDSLPDANITSQTETDYANPKTGQMTALKQWDFYTTGSAPSSLPTRQINYGYTNYDLRTETHFDSAGNTAASTTYNFTTTATATSGIVGHGTANAGGPYLTSVVATNNSPSGSITTSSTYEDTGALLTSTDANTNPVTTYKYDPTHTFVTEIDRPTTTTSGTAYTHVSKASYDLNSGAILSSDDENSVAHGQAYPVHYSYEAVAGRLQKISYPDGGSTSYAFPSATEVDTTVAQTSTVNVTTAQIVDGYGRNYQTTTGGITTEQDYDPNGRPYKVTNPQLSTSSSTDGATYTYYDALNRPSSIVYPGGATATIQIVGNVMTSKDEVGSQKKQTYNAFNELTQVLEPDPSSGALTLETDYQHDALGNITCVEQHGNVSGTGCSSPVTSDATSPWRVRRFFYNSLSQLRAARIPEHTFLPSAPAAQSCGTGSGDGHWTDCYVYDANGNLHAQSDNRAMLRSYTYDALNRRLTETSGNLSHAYAYDAGLNGVGLLFSQSNGSKTWSGNSYDSMGRTLSQASCASGTCSGLAPGATSSSYPATVVTYDLAGNMNSMAYPDSRLMTNNYDNLNRLSSVVYSKWGTQTIGTTYWSSSSYAPPGELTAAQYGAGNTGMQMQASFGPRQSIASLSYKSTSSTSPPTYFSKTYQWDQNAVNLLSETNQLNSQSRQYAYDKMNRLISATDMAASTAKATGTATITGREGTTSTCGDAVTSTATGDQPAITPPCTTIYDTGNVSITVGSFTVQTSYGKGSTINSIASSLTSQLNASGSPVSATSTGAAITMTALTTGTAGNYALSYSSDGDFNVTFSGATMTGGTSGTPVAGGLSQQYTLDAWGNLSSMGSSGLSLVPNVANQINNYTYDGAGRLLGDGHFSYTYDDDGMMLTSSDGGQYTYDAGGNRVAVVNSSGTKLYSYFGGTLVATYNPSTSAWTDMIYADNRIAEVAGTQTAPPVYSVLDHLGSEVGSVGTSTTSLDYAPFGQLISGSNPDSFIFTGLERDGSGLDHAEFRQYSSALARWTVPDPYDGSMHLASPQTLNRYAYITNSPLAGTDRSGLDGGTVSAPACWTAAVEGGTNPGADAGCGISLLLDYIFFSSLFGGSSFHGSLTPRPNARIWDEHGSFTPKAAGISDLLDIPKGGCEFGTCGAGFASGPGGPLEDHHLFAQEFRQWFAERGIDIDEFLIRMLRSSHRMNPDGLHTRAGGNWNAVWRQWIESNPRATAQDVWNQAWKMIQAFGIGTGDAIGDFLMTIDPCGEGARQSRYFDPKLCGGPQG